MIIRKRMRPYVAPTYVSNPSAADWRCWFCRERKHTRECECR